ncbi:MAG: MFS transporter, partial [Acidobacteriota bacterium]
MKRATFPTEAAEGTDKPLSTTTLVCYSVGEVPITITMALVGLLALFFYSSVMGLSGTLVGTGLAAGLAVDALFDPLIGFLSDASRHRFGRRHSFMATG